MTEEKIFIPILVVDDDPVSRTLLEKSLIRAGHKVTAAENGREALQTLKDNFFSYRYIRQDDARDGRDGGNQSHPRKRV